MVCSHSNSSYMMLYDYSKNVVVNDGNSLPVSFFLSMQGNINSTCSKGHIFLFFAVVHLTRSNLPTNVFTESWAFIKAIWYSNVAQKCRLMEPLLAPEFHHAQLV